MAAVANKRQEMNISIEELLGPPEEGKSGVNPIITDNMLLVLAYIYRMATSLW